jgi:hypothetical protein
VDQEWESNSTMVRTENTVTGIDTKKKNAATQATPSSQIEEKNAEVVYRSVKEIIFLNLCTEAETIE